MKAASRCPGVLLLVLVTTASLHADAAQEPGFHDVPIPGGIAALAPLGLPAEIERGMVLPELARTLYDPAERRDAQLAEIISFFSLIEEFNNTWLARVPADGVSREMTSTRQGRDRVNAVFEQLGLRLRQRQRVYAAEDADGRTAAARRDVMARAGIDTAQLARAFNDGEHVRPVVPVDVVPLPISGGALARAFYQRQVPTRALFGELLADRRAMLVLYGLTALDRETLAFLETDPDLLGRLYRDTPGAFAAYGRSLAVSGGEVVLPGPPAARSLWRAIIDEDPARPDRFIRALFGRESGRLALFYDTLANLDPARQQFAFGLSFPDARSRPDRFRDLYAAFATFDLAWSVEDQPFARRSHEPALMLQLVQVGPDGGFIGPAWRRFWQEALGGVDLPADPVRALRDAERDGLVEAAWLAGRLGQDATQVRGDRLDQLLFAQRVFANVEDALPDALVATRALVRYRAAMLTLERMGINRPATYAAVARHADALGNISDQVRATLALIQFQGGLAIVAQAVQAGSLDRDSATRLIDDLAALGLTNDRYRAGVIEWIGSALVPALPEHEGTGNDVIEARLVAALAGATRDADAPAFEWEGEQLRPAIGRLESQRIAAVRERQGTLSIDTVLRFTQLAREIEQGGATLDLDHVRRLAVTLREMASELRPAKPSPLYTDRLPAMRRQIDRAISELAKLTRPRDLQRLPRIAAPLLETADVLTADVIGSVAYAPHLGDAAGVVMLGEDMSRWHDFGVEAPIQEVRRRAAWQLPQEASGSPGVPRHLKGAMLGIDLGLARVQLQRLSTDLPERPTLSPNDMSAFAESVVLLAPDRTTDADRDEIRAALARGRARVTDALHDVDALELLAQDAGMGPWRRRALRWMVANEPDRVAEMFSLSEVFWLGEPRLTAADAWGASQASVSGCLCLRLPAPLPWESRAARLGAGLLGSHAPDVLLRTAELLAELQVPAMLIKPVMAYAAQALIDGARLWHGEDWRGLIRGAKALSRGQVEDFVAALVGRNLVVPAEGAPAPGR